METKPINFPGCKYNSVELAVRLREVARRFREYAKNRRVCVNFGCSYNTESHFCGTIACHGGLAALVLIPKMSAEVRYHFERGVIALNEFLGFKYDSGDETGFSFQNWAGRYPQYWGSQYGRSMFTSYGEESFGGRPYGKLYKTGNLPVIEITIFTIADWYDAVADRLTAGEQHAVR